jgi:phosphoserine phosphatase RsbU/P
VRILIADDDPSSSMIVKRSLERWGLDVIAVADGEAAWDVIRADATLGMAILDWEMPGSDGPALCRRIRQSEAAAALYVVLLTSRDHRKDVVAGLDAGADDYLTKPFDPEELRARVQVGIRVVTLQRTLGEHVAQLQAALSKVKLLSGLLPICSYCKRIRNDENYWEQMESYVTEHSDAQFSHGICPNCLAVGRADFER